MSQSQFLFPHQNLDSLSVPLEKYSFRTSRKSAKTAWTHIVGNAHELRLVVRNIESISAQGTVETRCLMQVTQSAEVLDTQDLGVLVSIYKQHLVNAFPGTESPIQIATRASIYLAMSYPRDEEFTHAIQFKFFSTIDFEHFKSVLKTLGLSMRDIAGSRRGASSVPPPTSKISPAPSLFSSSSTGTYVSAAASLSRPLTTSRSSTTIPVEPRLQNPALHWDVPHPQTDQFADFEKFAIQRHSGIITSEIQSSGGARINGSVQNPQQSSAPKFTSFYASQLENEKEAESHRNSPTFYQHTGIDRTGFSMAPQIPNAQFDKRTGTVEETPKQIIRSPFFPANLEDSAEQSRPLSRPLSSLTTASNQGAAHAVTEECRPMSAPLSASTIQDLYMPPRRKLPFSAPSTVEKTAEQSTIPVDNKSALPKPTPVTLADQVTHPPKVPPAKSSAATRQPAKRGKRTKKTPMERKEEQSLTTNQNESKIDNRSNALPTGQESPLAAKGRKAIRPASAMSGLQTKANPPRKRPASAQPFASNKKAKMVDCGIQTDTILTPSKCDKPPRADKPGSYEEEVPFAPTEEYLRAVDSFVTKNKRCHAPKHLLTTIEYQNAPQEERDALLNDFICRNLQDPKFRQLCKDMENAWRRIGLGS